MHVDKNLLWKGNEARKDKDMRYLPVNIYWESALNAASQTQRFASC